MIETNTRPKVNLKELFLPVIFANGEDDDVPGLVAAIANKPFQFDDRIYKRGEELVIDRRTIRLSATLIILGSTAIAPEVVEGSVVVREGDRKVTISNSFIIPPEA